jgi:hypothetical protein
MKKKGKLREKRKKVNRERRVKLRLKGENEFVRQNMNFKRS